MVVLGRAAFLVAAIFATLICHTLARAGGGRMIQLNAKGQFSVVIDTSDGSYNLALDGNTWMDGYGPAVRQNNKWYSQTSNSMSLKGVTTSSGSDELGSYDVANFDWLFGGSVPHKTSIRAYHNRPAIVFKQSFVSAIANSIPLDRSEVSSAYPRFDSVGMKKSLKWWTNTLIFGKNPVISDVPVTKDLLRAPESAPVVFYDISTTPTAPIRALVVTPLSNFMAGTITVSSEPDISGNFASGLGGPLEAVPADSSHETLIYAGHTINDTFYQSGQALLTYYGNYARSQVDYDVSTNWLGYWTDNGAYYYYWSMWSQSPNTTYQDIIIDVAQEALLTQLPFQYYQLDSWWYYQGVNNGVKLWEARPDIFPDGMAFVFRSIGKPLVLHNRYFSPDNDYSAMGFPFAITGGYAIPASQDLFEYIIGKQAANGMVTYEQDWLITSFLHVKEAQSNFTFARDWLQNMGRAAAKYDQAVQYCMPLTRHILQSVDVESTTQVRGSDDYQPSNDQWQMEYTSLLAWSVGLQVFKDNFWSSTNPQLPCLYYLRKQKPCQEVNSQLQAVVSALSAGPIAPGDRIDNLNVTRIMSTCGQTGLLLKPAKPATIPDFAFKQFGNQIVHISNTWSSWTTNNQTHRWHYLFAADLPHQAVVAPSDLETSGTWLAYDWHTQNMLLFTEKNPLVLTTTVAHWAAPEPVVPPTPFTYIVAAPVAPTGLAFLGETDKIISVSQTRFRSIHYDASSHAWVAVASGVDGEIVTISAAVAPYTSIMTTQCQIGVRRVSTFICLSSGCKCL